MGTLVTMIALDLIPEVTAVHAHSIPSSPLIITMISFSRWCSVELLCSQGRRVLHPLGVVVSTLVLPMVAVLV